MFEIHDTFSGWFVSWPCKKGDCGTCFVFVANMGSHPLHMSCGKDTESLREGSELCFITFKHPNLISYTQFQIMGMRYDRHVTHPGLRLSPLAAGTSGVHRAPAGASHSCAPHQGWQSALPAPLPGFRGRRGDAHHVRPPNI